MVEGRQAYRRDLRQIQVHDGRNLQVPPGDRQVQPGGLRTVPDARRRLQG